MLIIIQNSVMLLFKEAHQSHRGHLTPDSIPYRRSFGRTVPFCAKTTCVHVELERLI